MRGAGLCTIGGEGVEQLCIHFFFKYASRFVSYYKERNKQMTIKHNNLINQYYIKLLFSVCNFFISFVIRTKFWKGILKEKSTYNILA